MTTHVWASNVDGINPDGLGEPDFMMYRFKVGSPCSASGALHPAPC